MPRLLSIEPSTYTPHALHRNEDASWPETNCYVDLVIEVLHAYGLEPLAMLPFTMLMDFEGEQWTFFKPPHADILDLYGIEIVEHAIWRPLDEHVEEQVNVGRPIFVEIDSFYLPDTKGTTYRTEHGKTTIGVTRIDREKFSLDYFHNKGFYSLEEADYKGAFFIDPKPAFVLPPYVEVAKLEGLVKRPPAELADHSIALLRQHYSRRPKRNPFDAYRPRFERDLAWLLEQPMSSFHLYAFATVRQIGANYEMSAEYIKWLGANGHPEFAAAEASFRRLAEIPKTMQFKMARVAMTKKPFDYGTMFTEMASTFDTAMAQVGAALT